MGVWEYGSVGVEELKSGSRRAEEGSSQAASRTSRREARRRLSLPVSVRGLGGGSLDHESRVTRHPLMS